MSLAERIRDHYTERLLADAVFQVAPGHLSGLRVARADGSVKAGFVLPFRARPVAPSFDRPNVSDPAALEEAIAQAKKSLRLSSGTAALLVPEASVRVFVLNVDSFPGSGKERDAFIRWRVGKMMPVIPDDARIDYAATAGRGPRQVIVAMARQVVVWEYEALFEKAGLRPVAVTAPSLALANVVRRGGPASGLLLNLEEETLTLLALSGTGWTLYRQKDVGSPAGTGADERAETIVREAENTLRFLEDKERAGVDRIWFRSSLAAEWPALAARLKERIPLPVMPVEYDAPEVWTEAHRAVLAPLVGQVQR